MPFLLGEMPKGWLTCSKATPWLPSSPESQVLIWGAGTLNPPSPYLFQEQVWWRIKQVALW